MFEVSGTYQDGVFVPKTPVDLPNGTEVELRVEPRPPFRMMREEEWPTTPEGIAALLERWKEHEPPVLTPEDEARIAAWRAEMKRYNIEAVRKQMGLPE